MNNNKILTSVLLAGCLGVTGCQQYLERREGVTTHAGNQLAANEANMVVDPWPKHVDNTDIDTDGKRSADIVGKYKSAHAPEDTSGGMTLGDLLATPVKK